MKKIIYILAAIALFDGIIFGGIFYYKNLRGVGPAISQPPQDIAEVIANTPSPAVNNTDFPLHLPDGFSISIFAKDLRNPHVLQWGPDGNLWVSVPADGTIVALLDSDGNGVADQNKVLIDELNKPHGFTTYCASKTKCTLYIGETDQVSAVDLAFPNGNMTVGAKRKIADLPSGGTHFTRTIMWLPGQEGKKLLVSVGSSCNVCHEDDARRGAISQVDVRTGDLTPYANGLRNAVFMTVKPGTREVWATEMGRDSLSDDLPPDEVNSIAVDKKTGEAKNYGWPICFGNNIHDVDFDHNTYIMNPCLDPLMTPSVIDIPAHSAPLGLTFIPPSVGSTGSPQVWPEEYQNNLFVAYHGSWNRSIPTGYKVVRFSVDASSTPSAEKTFIDGWLTPDNKALGRPVDLLFDKDGSALYISDDKAGVVYRVVYRTPQTVELPIESGGCVITGCALRQCADHAIEGDNCVAMLLPQDRCYRYARCERQANNTCDWTVTDEAKACLNMWPERYAPN